MARAKRRVTLIHNESAGDGDHERRELTKMIAAAGYGVAYFNAKECDIARVVEKPADLIAAAGGDGTIRKVAALAKPDGPPLAILPLGTANNIANSLRIGGSLHDLIAGWKEARLEKFYPIELDAPWGRQRLIEGIGFGAFAQVIDEADGDDKLSPIEARKLLAEAVLRADAEPLRIRIDDALLSGEFSLLEVTTIPLLGPNLHLAPEANPADSLIDICSVGAEPEERQQLSHWLKELDPDAPAPLSTRSATHVAISGRFRRIRLDDGVRIVEAPDLATITLTSETEPLQFLVNAR